MSIRRQIRSFDILLFLCVCAISIFGIFIIGTVKSSSEITLAETGGGLANAYVSQRLFFISGLVLFALAVVIDYHFIARFYILIYVVAIGMLVGVLFVGPDATNTARWFRIGNLFSIQPSEFAKIFLILFLAKFIDKTKENINDIRIVLLIIAFVALPAFLIKIQPSLSASLVIMAIGISLLFASGLSFRYIIAFTLIVLPVALLLWHDIQNPENPIIATKILGRYQWEDRILMFFNPEVGSDLYYQINRSLSAVSSGLLGGKGIGNGTWIPQGSNDFIFAVLAEQFGFQGCVAVLAVMFIIIAKCIRVAATAPDMLGRMIAIGVAAMIAFETFVNVSVVTNLLPNTGMPFPFMSSGGSAMWVHMVAMGLVINVGLSKQRSFFED